MTRRPKKRSVKARNPIAKDLRDPIFHLRLKPSKKTYQRKPKHRGRSHGADLGSGIAVGMSSGFGASTTFRQTPRFGM